MELKVYCDGSYLPKYPKYSGWGYYILDDDDVLHYDCGKVECESRNIDGECHAVVSALKHIYRNYEDVKNISVYYDYIGIQKWADGEWKTNKNVSINYKKNIDKIKKRLNNTNIIWIKVKSHSGNTWNDAVDLLCKKGLENN